MVYSRAASPTSGPDRTAAGNRGNDPVGTHPPKAVIVAIRQKQVPGVIQVDVLGIVETRLA